MRIRLRILHYQDSVAYFAQPGFGCVLWVKVAYFGLCEREVRDVLVREVTKTRNPEPY